jgi:hypothetical protein
LKGPLRGVYFDAYVILDIYSRKAIHWEVHATENLTFRTSRDRFGPPVVPGQRLLGSREGCGFGS